MIIEDGVGSGKSAKVNNSNMIAVSAISMSVEHYINHDLGLAFNVLFAVNPDGAGDCIFYLKNTDDMDLVISGIWWQTSAAEEVYYKLGDIGTPVLTNGSAIIPVNLNAGSGKIASVLCYSNTADGAVDITGLSGGTTIQQLWLTNAASEYFDLQSDIVLPKNTVFTIYCVGGDTNLRGTVAVGFHSMD